MILEPGWRNSGRRCIESNSVTISFGIRDGMLAAKTERVVPLSYMIRYCGDEAGSRGISIMVPEWVHPEVG